MKSKLTYLKKFELIKVLEQYSDGQFFAIADARIKNHLPQWIQFSPNVFWLRDPESEKCLEVYGVASEFFIKQGIQRSSQIFAFGGGATTDFAGFVAATILRGINWTSIPTTLLAMIDGSIGGKVALNLPQGKNLIGAYHAPSEVIICVDFLSTLSEKELISGKGEILKYGFLSREIYDLINKKVSLEEIICECARYKTRIIEDDFKEEGNRILLNLGHTLGHAFEAHLKISHGQAVAMGLKYILKVMGLDTTYQTFEKMCSSVEFPIERLEIRNFPNFNLNVFLGFLEADKKKIESKIRLILVKYPGNCYVEEVLFKDFKNKIQKYVEFQG